MEFNENERKFLLNLARKTLEFYFDRKDYRVDTSEVPEKLKQKRGCFVTLTKNGSLRGCIGYIEPIKPLYRAVMENSINAAMHDPRFAPLKKEELSQITIEVSVLTVPERLEYSSTKELLDKLNPKMDGVIIKKGYNEATYLPQVWEELKTKEEFLSTLCLKAGLNIDCWQKNPKVYVYHAEYFKEKKLVESKNDS